MMRRTLLVLSLALVPLAAPAQEAEPAPPTSPPPAVAKRRADAYLTRKESDMFMLNLPATARPEGACRINGRDAEYRLFPDRIEFRYGVGDPWESRAILDRCPVGGVVLYVCDDGTADEPLALLKEVGELRLAREAARGGVSLPLPEQEVSIEGDHWHLEYRAQLPTEQWNAQISLLTGMAAASDRGSASGTVRQ